MAYVNMRGYMLRWNKKYMSFFGTITERDFREKIQSTETYTNNATLRSDLSAKHAQVWSHVNDLSRNHGQGLNAEYKVYK